MILKATNLTQEIHLLEIDKTSFRRSHWLLLFIICIASPLFWIPQPSINACTPDLVLHWNTCNRVISYSRDPYGSNNNILHRENGEDSSQGKAGAEERSDLHCNQERLHGSRGLTERYYTDALHRLRPTVVQVASYRSCGEKTDPPRPEKITAQNTDCTTPKNQEPRW